MCQLGAFLQSLVSRLAAQSIRANSAKFTRDGCSNNSFGGGSVIHILILNEAALPAPWEVQLAERGDPMPVTDSLTPP